jgi:hypothetical protein
MAKIKFLVVQNRTDETQKLKVAANRQLIFAPKKRYTTNLADTPQNRKLVKQNSWAILCGSTGLRSPSLLDAKIRKKKKSQEPEVKETESPSEPEDSPESEVGPDVSSETSESSDLPDEPTTEAPEAEDPDTTDASKEPDQS